MKGLISLIRAQDGSVRITSSAGNIVHEFISRCHLILNINQKLVIVLV
jgi:hypothetical protein